MPMSTDVITAHAALDPPASHWTEIPILAGRMLWRHWPALVFWFFAMRFSYDLMRDSSIWLAGFSILFSYAAVAVMIVMQLAGTIAMFLTVRPSMCALATATPVRDVDALSIHSPWMGALSVALLPFFAYSATWGLLDGIRRDFYLNYFFGVSFNAHERLFDIFSVRGLWIAVVVAGTLRWYAKRRRAANGHFGWSVLVTACEAYWIFVGAAAISAGWSLLDSGWKGTVVFTALRDWWGHPFFFTLSLAPLRAVVEPVWRLVATLASAAVLPLVWLAIVAIVYGIDLRRRQHIDAADGRLDDLTQRYLGMHFLVQKLVAKLSAGWNNKGVPVINSMRLVLRAGLPALLVLCVSWTLLDYIDAWAFPVLMHALGPVDPRDADQFAPSLLAFVNGPMSMRPALLTQILRVVLLAATFDRALVRIRAAG